MDLSKLTLGDKIIAGAGIALVIDLLLLPWHKIDAGIIELTRTGIQSPNGFWGLLAMLLAAAMAAAVLVRRLTSTDLPDLPVPWDQALFIAGLAIAGLLALKLVLETDFLGFGAYLGILLAGGMAYGGFLVRKEAGPASSGSGPSPTI